MILARMIHFFVPSKSVWGLNPGILAVVFVSLDIVSFIVQAIGGDMANPGSDSSTIMTGVHIYMGGIGLQEFFILVFLTLAVRFHIQMQRVERTDGLYGTPKGQWRKMIYALYASLIFITVRIIFRLVEFSSGISTSNPLPYHEVYAYVFDALPMILAIFVWNIVHPGGILVGPDSVMPSGVFRRLCCCCCCGRRKKKTITQNVETSNIVLVQGANRSYPERDIEDTRNMF
jgi:RTA1 like protein